MSCSRDRQNALSGGGSCGVSMADRHGIAARPDVTDDSSATIAAVARIRYRGELVTFMFPNPRRRSRGGYIGSRQGYHIARRCAGASRFRHKAKLTLAPEWI